MNSLLLTLALTAAAPLRSIAAFQTPASKEADPVLARILELARDDNRVQEHLKFLCKSIGPRLTGTARYDQAAEWAVDTFRSFGLDARLEVWGEFPIAFERGHASGGMVEPEVVDFTFQTPAWTPGTDGRKRGPAVLEPASEADALSLEPRLKGAWMVHREPPPAAKVRSAARRACAAAGALGTVRPGNRNGRLHMGGSPRSTKDSSADTAAPLVQIQLLHTQHADLHHRLTAGEAVELEFDVANRVSPGPVACANVVADLKGREKPDEFVVVGGHLDSWDGAEGAQDDGAGCVTAIEAARLIAAAGGRPRRTIRFVLFGGEEQGLLGSSGYVKSHADELENTSLALIHDGGSTALVGLSTTYAMLADFERVFAPVARLEPDFPFVVRESDGLENSGDSDHASFLQAGVPGFFWKQSEIGYEHVHHTQFDVFETVDPREMKHSARVVAVAAWGFAELDHLLDRTDDEPVARRRLGITLATTPDGATVQSVFDNGKAAAAGWREGDRILTIDGVEVKAREDVTEHLGRGGPKKTIRLGRGEEVVESALDWSDDRAEKQRSQRAERREAWMRARSPK